MFHLPTYEDCIKIVQANDAFKHTVQEVDGFKLHDFGYRLPGYMDFADPLKDGGSIQAWELRGLSFVESPDGTFERYLMLNKFHCLNQTKGSMYNDVKDKVIDSVTDKRDGSLIRFIRLPNGRLVAKSKGSFVGPHCELALQLLEANPYLKEHVMFSLDLREAIIFEMTGPVNEVVLKYEQPELRIVQVRDEETGEYACKEDMEGWAEIIAHHMRRDEVEPVNYFVDSVNVKSLDELIALQKTERNVEGWVIRFKDGTLIKVKTDWYEDMHRHMIEKQRTDKTFIEMTINETMDDALGLMPIGDPIRIRMEEVMTKVSRHFNHTVSDVVKTVATYSGDKSAFAAVHKANPNFGIYMFAISKGASEKDIEGHVKRAILGACKSEKDATRFLASL